MTTGLSETIYLITTMKHSHARPGPITLQLKTAVNSLSPYSPSGRFKQSQSRAE